jgi:L-iditol 2-dehydrogenase
MRAIKYFGKEDIRLVEIPTPSPGDGEVLIKVRAASLCASDVKIYFGIKEAKNGVTLGHEVSGEVFKVGKNVKFRVGDRVTIFPSLSCGECFYCKRGHTHLCLSKESIGYVLDGGFAEFMLIPKGFVERGNIFPLPQNISFEMGSLVEPLSTVISSVEMAGVEEGERVAIFGAGPMGLIHLILLKYAYNPSSIFVIEPLSERRKLALQLGADYTMIPGTHIIEDIISSTEGIGIDRGFICHGDVRTIELAIRSLRKRGVITLFASFKEEASFLVNPNTLHYGEIIITGTHSATKEHFRRAIEFLERGLDLSPLLTHRFNLNQFEDGLRVYTKKEGLKIIFTP